MEEVGEVSSCTVDCDCAMMCMCVRESASVSACMLADLRLSACSPCPRPCVYDTRSAAHACLLLQCKPEPTDHNIAYKSEFAVRVLIHPSPNEQHTPLTLDRISVK